MAASPPIGVRKRPRNYATSVLNSDDDDDSEHESDTVVSRAPADEPQAPRVQPSPLLQVRTSNRRRTAPSRYRARPSSSSAAIVADATVDATVDSSARSAARQAASIVYLRLSSEADANRRARDVAASLFTNNDATRVFIDVDVDAAEWSRERRPAFWCMVDWLVTTRREQTLVVVRDLAHLATGASQMTFVVELLESLNAVVDVVDEHGRISKM